MLKDLLGEELYAQVQESLKGKGKDGKDLEVVIGNDGSYVPATKYDDLRNQLNHTEQTLKSVSSTMKELGGSGDPAKLSDDIKQAQTKMKDIQKAHSDELTQLKKVSAVKRKLTGKVHDPNDVMGFFNLEDLELDEHDDLKSDIEATLKPYRESKPYLFKDAEKVVETTPTIRGAIPAEPHATTKSKKTEGPVAF